MSNSENYSEFDEIDRRVASILSYDASITNAVLSQMLGLSISATNDRIRKLKKYGIIKRIAAFVDASFLGKGTAAFISFNLNASSAEDELANLYEHENVSEIHNISGRYAHKIKVRFNNVHALNEFLMSYIKTKMKVTDYSLEVVLSSSKEESVIVGQ